MWRLKIATAILVVASLACSLGAPASNPEPSAIPTSELTATPDETTAVSAENTLQPTPSQTCVPRTDWQTTVVAPGDTLSGIAQRSGTTVDDLIAANCLANADAIAAGQTLVVPFAPANPTFGSVGNSPDNCSSETTWFFNFTNSLTEGNCPGELITSNAVGQNFQNGRIYRYDPGPGETQAMIYAIYNDGTWAIFPDTWTGDQPMDDPNIVPPPGWYKPVGDLGKFWREQPGQRDKLGWAYAPEGQFTGRRQAPLNNASYLYIDHGLRNLVLRLNNMNGVPSNWQVVGIY
jgi:LysM repeat protein